MKTTDNAWADLRGSLYIVLRFVLNCSFSFDVCDLIGGSASASPGVSGTGTAAETACRAYSHIDIKADISHAYINAYIIHT